MNTATPQDGEQLHRKIVSLIDHLEKKVSEVKDAYTAEIEALTMRCREDMQKVQLGFSQELDIIEQNHKGQLTALEREIGYLKEMSQSQRMMMETNLQYIKELEHRYVNLIQAKQS